jgi:16S rRNA (guanine966-N2)-methyltransferase
VTRIVAGQAKGRRLAVPDGGTRPTSDRAREGLFNTLATLLELDGARVLDLFAGSGGVGLEALSRGAAQVVLVDSGARAVATLHANVAAVGLPGAEVARQTVAEFVAGSVPAAPFDMVFADPPYALPDADLAVLLAALVAGSWFAERSIVVIERSARGPGPQWPDVMEEISHRRYGEGTLWYGRRR